MGNSPPPPPPKPYDRVFILIGNTKAGKSTLGNLILCKESFKVVPGESSTSTTASVQFSDSELAPGTVLGMNLNGDNSLRLKVVDQPGLDDSNFDVKKHCDHLIKCMSEVNVKTFPTFLIVIDLTLECLSDNRGLTFIQLSESLMQASYSLFSHAVVVFTHIDQLDSTINNTSGLEQMLRQKCRQKHWEELEDILAAVGDRYIFVNGVNPEALYRNRILRELFLLTKSTLHIRFHGNNYFTSDFLKRKLGIHGDELVEEELYKLDYQFQPDLNLFWRDEVRELDFSQQIRRALLAMIALGEGVSSVAILVSLLKSLSKEMEELIYDIPSCYFDEEDPQFELRKTEWWKHVFFVFEVPNEVGGRECVVDNLSRNTKIRTLIERGSKKWTWIAKDTPMRLGRDRITETCLEVRKQIGGREFIQNTVNRELRRVKRDVDRYEGENTQVPQYSAEFHKKMAKGEIQFLQSDERIVMKIGEVAIRDEISISSMRMILRNMMLSREEMERFREHFEHPNARVSIREVLDFLANP